jgi:hypothetical protein
MSLSKGMNTSQKSERESAANTQYEPNLTEYETSRWIGRSVPSLRRDRLLGRGILFIKCGSLVRYAPGDVRAYLERNKHGVHAEAK